jgi:hypothetical protein
MSIPVMPVTAVMGTAGTQGWCGDGRTICQGGGYGAQWDQQRGMNFGKGFADGVGNQSGGGTSYQLGQGSPHKHLSTLERAALMLDIHVPKRIRPHNYSFHLPLATAAFSNSQHHHETQEHSAKHLNSDNFIIVGLLQGKCHAI